MLFTALCATAFLFFAVLLATACFIISDTPCIWPCARLCWRSSNSNFTCSGNGFCAAGLRAVLLVAAFAAGFAAAARVGVRVDVREVVLDVARAAGFLAAVLRALAVVFAAAFAGVFADAFAAAVVAAFAAVVVRATRRTGLGKTAGLTFASVDVCAAVSDLLL